MSANVMTIATVLELMSRMLASNDSAIYQHAKTLTGPRRRGSTTEIGLEQLAGSIELQKVEHPVIAQGCTGWMFKSGLLDGRIGAMPLLQAFKDGHSVAVRQGEHGEELYISKQAFPIPASVPAEFTYLIMGPPNEYADFPDGIIYTWHPGEPLLPVVVKGKISIGCSTAVKFV